jgi:proline iminopeptidase
MKITIARLGVPTTRLYVETMGQENTLSNDRPVAFILPGGPGADHTAYLNYECLKERVDLVFHDPRGCGKSDRGDPSSYTMNHYIDDIESLREQLSLNKIIIIGKSYGSICALGYALRYPHAVAKLVLSAGAPSFRFLETAKRNVKRHGTPEQIKMCEKLWKGSFKNRDDVLTFFQVMNSLYSIRARMHPDEFDLAKKSMQFSYEVLNEGFRHSFWYFDYENELQRIVAPTLVLAGRHDWINDSKHAEFMAARIPHSQLRVFEEASHAMEADVPEEYFQTIGDFIF